MQNRQFTHFPLFSAFESAADSQNDSTDSNSSLELKKKDFLVTAQKGLSWDSARTHEMTDDALKLSWAWNGMFVYFVKGYNVGQVNLN